jgi:hypothetical protein
LLPYDCHALCVHNPTLAGSWLCQPSHFAAFRHAIGLVVLPPAHDHPAYLIPFSAELD